jgi:phage gp36-like protein
MAYCTTSEIQALISTNLWDASATSPVPTVTQVEEWIAEIDAEIDSKLSGRYVTPITGTKALQLVSTISARMVAMRIWAIVFTGATGQPGVPDDWREARKTLDALAAGTSVLEDAEALGVASEIAPGSAVSTFPADRTPPDMGQASEPIFSMQDTF